LPTFIAFRRGFREDELKGNKVSKEDIRDFVKIMAERGSKDRKDGT